MQVMGQTAVEFGFPSLFPTELCDPNVGIEYGCKKLRSCLANNAMDVRKALLCYNGGDDLEYPDEVLKRMEHYK
jgi:soluble lytic murein transglycosylase-like protein